MISMMNAAVRETGTAFGAMRGDEGGQTMMPAARLSGTDPSPPSVTAIQMYCRFCDDVSISADTAAPSFAKMLILSQKNINVTNAYNALFPAGEHHAFLDWERVDLLCKGRVYTDSASWVQALVDYVVEEGLETESDLRPLLAAHPVLQHYHSSLKQAGGNMLSQVMEARLFARLYVLINVHRLQSLHAVERLFSVCFRCDVRHHAMAFFSHQADQQFDHDAQTLALVALFKRHVRVRRQAVEQELDIIQMRSQELEGLFRMKSMQAATGRPKLRAKLARSSSSAVAGGGVGAAEPTFYSLSLSSSAGASSIAGESSSSSSLNAASGGGGANVGMLFDMDKLSHWTAYIRFPNIFSIKQCERLYFVMAQTTDPTESIRGVLADTELCNTVLRYPVKQPEVEVIHKCIVECRVVSEPFPELHLFRASCFNSFAQEHKTMLRLNDLLHLFIAAYQNPIIWKTVWKMVFPVLSIQIIRDVETFVARVPFPQQSVMSIMFRKSMAEGSQHITKHVGSTSATPIPSPSEPDSPLGHRVRGEPDDAAHGVGRAERPALQALAQGGHAAAPLDHQALPVEPPSRGGGAAQQAVALVGLDAEHAPPAEADCVENEDARRPVLHEELPAEHGVGRAPGAEDARGVGGEAHLARVDVDERVVDRADKQDHLCILDSPCPEIYAGVPVLVAALCVADVPDGRAAVHEVRPGGEEGVGADGLDARGRVGADGAEDCVHATDNNNNEGGGGISSGWSSSDAMDEGDETHAKQKKE
jgi:hypothetical protein